jgi:hypothetical protein
MSPPLVGLTVAAFAGGVVAGYIAHLQRSPVLHKHLPGTSAWPQQLVVAAIAGAVFGYAYCCPNPRTRQPTALRAAAAPKAVPNCRRPPGSPISARHARTEEKPTILVTGATGITGSELVRTLAGCGLAGPGPGPRQRSASAPVGAEAVGGDLSGPATRRYAPG